MGIIDKVGDIAGDIALDLVARKLGELASYLLTAAFGDSKDDTAKEKLARALAEAGAAGLEQLAKERLAAKELPEKFRKVLGDIAAIDVAKLFTPKAVEAGPQEVRFVCELTVQSWSKLLAQARAHIVDPTEREREIFGAVGSYAGTVIVVSDADRRVPLDIARILEAE